MTIRILIAVDHPVVRAGLRALLNTEQDMTVVGEASDGADAVALHAVCQPDVTLMDLRMPKLTGVAATSAILVRDPGARIIVLTTYDGDPEIDRAIDAGACSYLIKDSLGREVVGAVRAHSAR